MIKTGRELPLLTNLRSPRLLTQEGDQFICHDALFGSVRTTSLDARQRAMIVLRGLRYNSAHTDELHEPGDISRIESFRFGVGDTEMRGMVVFASSHYHESTFAVVHFADALLGYDGSGAELGRRILKESGVPDVLINHAEKKIRHRDYKFIFSREAVEYVAGRASTLPYVSFETTWALHTASS